MKTKLIILGLSLSMSSAFAQTTKEYMMDHIEYTAGNYTDYPVSFPSQTKAPKGYEPFYISHYGRHGSRYHHTASDYKMLYDMFNKADSANALTLDGKSVKNRFEQMYKRYYDRAGDLTTKGTAQHRAIADRMFHSFPQIFHKNAVVEVKASTSVRCVMSMDAFCQELKSLQPTLDIHAESSKRNMYYISNDPMEDKNRRLADTAWSRPFGDLHYRLIHPTRMVKQLFSDMDYVSKNIDTIPFMRKFYEVNSSLICDDSDINFKDVWTKEELYNNWVIQNAWWYGAYGPCPLTRNRSRFFAKDLLNIMIDEADVAIQTGNVQANLRFGHDIAIMPLTALMELQGCRDQVTNVDSIMNYWNEFRIVPMASNVQMIFYRSKKDPDVLVKIMLNEREVDLPLASDVAPYYKWDEVRTYYKDILKSDY